MLERSDSILGNVLNLIGAIISKAAVAGILTLLLHDIFGSYIAIEALFIMVVVDFITGITRCVKLQCLITSRGLGATATKMLKYLLLIIATHQLTRISGSFEWVETFIALFCGVTELLSIIENLSQAGIIIPKWVVDKLHNYLNTGDLGNNLPQ